MSFELLESPRVEIKSPETVYVPEGTNLSLVCLAVGWPRPQLTWTRGDELLLNQTSNGTYIQRHVTLEDGGIYTCSAKNQFGIEYRSVKVIVLGEFLKIRPYVSMTSNQFIHEIS